MPRTIGKTTTHMKFQLVLISFCFGFGLALTTTAAEELPLNAHLQMFLPFLGKTWKETFANSTPDKPIIDVQKWERTLNGQAIRLLHSINQGAYGGETLFIWDDQRKTVV